MFNVERPNQGEGNNTTDGKVRDLAKDRDGGSCAEAFINSRGKDAEEYGYTKAHKSQTAKSSARSRVSEPPTPPGIKN